jgi:hypothetical protein
MKYFFKPATLMFICQMTENEFEYIALHYEKEQNFFSLTKGRKKSSIMNMNLYLKDAQQISQRQYELLDSYYKNGRRYPIADNKPFSLDRS